MNAELDYCAQVLNEFAKVRGSGGDSVRTYAFC